MSDAGGVGRSALTGALVSDVLMNDSVNGSTGRFTWPTDTHSSADAQVPTDECARCEGYGLIGCELLTCTDEGHWGECPDCEGSGNG